MFCIVILHIRVVAILCFYFAHGVVCFYFVLDFIYTFYRVRFIVMLMVSVFFSFGFVCFFLCFSLIKEREIRLWLLGFLLDRIHKSASLLLSLSISYINFFFILYILPHISLDHLWCVCMRWLCVMLFVNLRFTHFFFAAALLSTIIRLHATNRTPSTFLAAIHAFHTENTHIHTSMQQQQKINHSEDSSDSGIMQQLAPHLQCFGGRRRTEPMCRER